MFQILATMPYSIACRPQQRAMSGSWLALVQSAIFSTMTGSDVHVRLDRSVQQVSQSIAQNCIMAAIDAALLCATATASADSTLHALLDFAYASVRLI